MKKKVLVFAVLFLTMYVSRTDQGILPALNSTLKKEFGMSNIELGSLGSMVYFGAFVGSMVAIPLFDLFPTKLVLIGCCVLQMMALGAFTVVTSYWPQAVARFASGACQVIFAIFLPVWTDVFAPTNSKTRWLTLTITAAPLGLLTGYGISAIIVTVSNRWEMAFIVIIMLMLPLACGIFCI